MGPSPQWCFHFLNTSESGKIEKQCKAQTPLTMIIVFANLVRGPILWSKRREFLERKGITWELEAAGLWKAMVLSTKMEVSIR